MTTKLEYMERLSVLDKKEAVLRTALNNIVQEKNKIKREMADKFENPTQYIGKRFKRDNETYEITNVHCFMSTGYYSVTYNRVLKKDNTSLSVRCYSMDFKAFIQHLKHDDNSSSKITLL